jgi:hypothetical protein
VSRSLGLEFLIEKVNAVKSEAESTGQISDASMLALRARIGLTKRVRTCIATNSIYKTESARRLNVRVRHNAGTAIPSPTS